MASATLLSSPTLSFLDPNPNPNLRHPSKPLLSSSSRSSFLPFQPLRFSPSKPFSLRLDPTSSRFSLSMVKASILPPPPQTPTLLSDATRTLSSLLALVLSLSKALTARISALAARLAAPPTPSDVANLRAFQSNLACAAGPLFFAAIRDRPSGYLNTPLTVVASGMAKWLDIYSGVLMVRVLLSWFPNIPWDRQPLSAIRDLCDPYLNLFRNIIPPIFDTLDVSPLLAFAVLGTLGSVLNNSRGKY